MSQSDTYVRTATRDDATALARLRARNGRLRRSRALVAEEGREIIGAIDLTSGAILADPARSTPEMVHALRRRRYELLRQGGVVRHARFSLTPAIREPNVLVGP